MSKERNTGKLFVLSGPSGAGKGTICKKLLEGQDMHLSVSMTTRKPREGEVDGVSYYFTSKEDFLKKVEEGGLLEYAEAYGNYYGTPKGPVTEKLTEGKDVLLEIEMQGALQVKESYPESILVFILPPSLEILRERLTGRGTETAEAIEMRLGETLNEFTYIEKYDYFVINDDLDEAVEKVKAIAAAEHAKVSFTAEEIISKYKEGK